MNEDKMPSDFLRTPCRRGRKEAGMDGATALRFGGEGTFRLMQVADVQESVRVRPETTLLLERALDEAHPDLVVFTGDQLKGYSPMLHAAGKAGVRATISEIVRPIVERGIPFAVTYGNHDCQAGLSNAEQEAFYDAEPGCLNATFGAEGKEAGTFCVPIASSDGSDTVMAVWLAYSGTDARGGGYEPFDPATTRWIVDGSEALAQAAGHRVPGILFQHIPMPAIYSCLRVARPGERGVPGYRDHYMGGVELCLDETCRLQGTLGETICCGNEDTGEFASLRAQGDVFAAFFGHDHKNSFVARLGGMLLGYAPTASFSSYGPGIRRAVRVFEFDEDDPRHPRTWLLGYPELVGATTTQPARDWAKAHMVTTIEEAASLLPRPSRRKGSGDAAGAGALART
jgi:hypothetical protein